MQYLTDLLTANSPEQFSNNRSKNKIVGRPSLLVADRWLQGEHPLPVPTGHNSTGPYATPKTQQPPPPKQKSKDILPHNPPHPLDTSNLVTHIVAQHNMSSSTRTTTIPKRITMHPSTCISTQTINPDRDALTPAGTNKY